MVRKRSLTAVILTGILALGVLGCGTREDKPVTSQRPAENISSLQDDADTKLNQSVALAKIHVKHREFEKAEQVLEAALTDAGSADTTEALRLLDQVKTELAKTGASAASPSQPAKSTAVEENKSTPEKPVPPTTGVADADKSSDTPANQAEQVKQSNKPVKEAPAVTAQTPQPAATRDRSDKANVATTEQKPGEDGEKTPTNIVKTPATDLDLRRLENQAVHSETAREALDLYHEFRALHTLTAEQAAEFDSQQAVWKERADKKMVRLGIKWFLPEEAEAAAREADQLVEQAKALLEVGNYKAAVSYFEQASTVDPNGIRADYVLGLLYALPYFLDDISAAEKHFRTVLNRFPGHVGALNNLAITEVKLREFSSAYNHWREAVLRAPGHPDVGHNLGRLINASSQNKITVNRGQLGRFNKLYAEFVTTHEGTSANLGVGWRYSPLILPEKEKQREENSRKQPVDDKGEHLFYAASGTGFVIHGTYILTNRHVVKDSRLGLPDSVGIIDPSDPKHEKELRASVVSVSDKRDLAIIKCDELNAAAVSVDVRVPERGTEVLVLGYPHTENIGRSLKATKGIVSAGLDAQQENMLMFDAEANPGNSGGPVCNQSGNVVAVMTVKYNAEMIGNYSGGIPMIHAVPFVEQHVPEFQPQAANGPRLDWIAVDRKNAPSTVLIRTYYREFPFALNQATPDTKVERQHYLEDVSCVVCNGTAQRPCPGKGCNGGKKSVRRRVRVATNPLTKQPVYGTRVFPVKCTTCNGRGSVSCPYCLGGIDRQIIRLR